MVDHLDVSETLSLDVVLGWLGLIEIRRGLFPTVLEKPLDQFRKDGGVSRAREYSRRNDIMLGISRWYLILLLRIEFRDLNRDYVGSTPPL